MGQVDRAHDIDGKYTVERVGQWNVLAWQR
jgi:hypothetical protein